uniref:Zinc finger GRF-type domain-containing protein n=1 Tax=Brassica oleracea TaxID=3712 RepID=A0A3P6FPN0_BRAOL|nr:unnamed protein product [Brassica oleracea]
MTHPDEEYRDMKKAKRENDMRGYINDAHHGILTRCFCGERIVNKFSPAIKFPGDFDTLPGRRYFTCAKFENDGFHFCHSWVFAMKEDVKGMLSRVDEMYAQIDKLKDQLKRVTHP